MRRRTEPALYARTAAPNADDISNALVAAARHTGEVEYLRLHATAIMTGTLALRARWMALAALQRVWPGSLVQLARRWCGPTAPHLVLRKMRKAGWWSDAKVTEIAANLRDAHAG